jgi:hypothetical protein
VRSSVPGLPAAAATLAISLSCMLFLLSGCGQGEEAAEKAEDETTIEEAADEGNAITEVALEPVNNSGAGGAAVFSETSQGVEVELSVGGLPDPGATYLSHIHPGTCAEEGRERRASGEANHSSEGEAHEGEGHEGEAGHGDEHESEMGEIEYPLTPVIPDAEGNGSSTTVLKDVTADELFSGDPKFVNAHASGSGNPPVLACGDLPAEEGTL